MIQPLGSCVFSTGAYDRGRKRWADPMRTRNGVRSNLREFTRCGIADLLALGLGTALLAFSSVSDAADGQTPPPRTSIPEISRIGKVQIGYSSQEDLDRVWGEGKMIIGGHATSGRVWRIKNSTWLVNTDGFDYSPRGLVVDGFSLSASTDSPSDVPYTKLPKKDFAWLGGISLGMSKNEVMQILHRKSLAVIPTKDGCQIKARGFSPITSTVTPIRNWKATLTFAKGVLIKLQLGATMDH